MSLDTLPKILRSDEYSQQSHMLLNQHPKSVTFLHTSNMLVEKETRENAH